MVFLFLVFVVDEICSCSYFAIFKIQHMCVTVLSYPFSPWKRTGEFIAVAPVRQYITIYSRRIHFVSNFRNTFCKHNRSHKDDKSHKNRLHKPNNIYIYLKFSTWAKLAKGKKETINISLCSNLICINYLVKTVITSHTRPCAYCLFTFSPSNVYNFSNICCSR